MATLEMTATATVSAAVNAFGDVGRAAQGMASDVTRAATSAASRMDTVGEAADGVGSRTSQAAGGLGDLAGGLQAAGLVSESTAAQMETGAAAIQGLTGVMDLANLALTLQPVKWIAAKAQQVAYAVASKATAAAQWALNAAMAANPIGLLIAVIAALVVGLVIAYKKSETFRNIVNKAFGVVKAVAGAVVSAVVGYFRLWGQVVSTVAGVISNAITRVVGFVRDIPGKVKGALSGAGTWLVDTGRNVIEGLINGIKAMASRAISAVTDVINDAIGGAKRLLGISSPSRLFKQYGQWTSEGLSIGIQDKAGMVASAAAGLARKVADGFDAPRLSLNATAPGTVASGNAQGTTIINLTVNGAVDPDGTARTIIDLIRRYSRMTGQQVLVTP